MDNRENSPLNTSINKLVASFERHCNLVQENSSTIKSNLFDMLQDFWLMKMSQQDPTGISNQIVYEFIEKPSAPYVCFVTLPGGACFATFQVSSFRND